MCVAGCPAAALGGRHGLLILRRTITVPVAREGCRWLCLDDVEPAGEGEQGLQRPQSGAFMDPESSWLDHLISSRLFNDVMTLVTLGFGRYAKNVLPRKVAETCVTCVTCVIESLIECRLAGCFGVDNADSGAKAG